MEIRIAGLTEDSIVDGPGFRLTVFTQGCVHACEGCHNPETHDPKGGREASVDEIVAEMLKNPLTDGLTLSGGEPFLQARDCALIAKAAREAGLNVWSYSGYVFEELVRDEEKLELLRLCDVLVDGPFILEEKTLNLLWRGSGNQRLIDVPASLAAVEPLLYEG